jgi:hypothetical protein
MSNRFLGSRLRRRQLVSCPVAPSSTEFEGYAIAALENVFATDHTWARLVVEEIREKIADPATMRALGYTPRSAKVRE